MTITIPTVEDIVEKYQGVDLDNPEARKEELMKSTKEELVAKIIELETNKSGTVQELAKAILKDEKFIAADYGMIAEAIRQIMPEAKTTSKSIASYVSKKKEEWELPRRIRISS